MDKTSIEYFMTEMTQEEFQKMNKETPLLENYDFNRIKKEDE